MDLEKVKLIISLVVSCFSLLLTLIITLKKIVNNKKILDVLDRIEDVTEEIIPLIIEAETFVNYTGEEKKQYVMTKLNQLAIDNGVDFDSNRFSNQIEELIELSNEVNVFSKKNNIDITNNIKRIIDNMKE